MASFDDSAQTADAGWYRSRPTDRAWLGRYVRGGEIRGLHGAAAALAVVLVAAAFVRLGLTPDAVVAAAFFCVLIALSVVDIEQRRLPNRIVLPATVAMLAVQSALHPDRTLEWVVAAAGAALLLAIPLFVYPGAMGMGDVKLALLLGSGLGASVTTTFVFAFIGAGLFALAIVVRDGTKARRQTIAFGPFLAAGAIATILMG